MGLTRIADEYQEWVSKIATGEKEEKREDTFVQFYQEAISRAQQIFNEKNEAYGGISNFLKAEEWGVRPTIGVLIRLNDKVSRLQQWARNGGGKPEDELLDIMNYAAIAYSLLRQTYASQV